MRHSATLGGACAPAGKRVGLTRHVLSHFFAVALCLGTLAGSLDAIGLTTVRPAGATAAPVVKDTLHCWAETNKLTEGATDTVTYVATSTPATITPGGGFTDTFAPNGSGQVPAKTGTYKITWFGNRTTRLALAATSHRCLGTHHYVPRVLLGAHKARHTHRHHNDGYARHRLECPRWQDRQDRKPHRDPRRR